MAELIVTDADALKDLSAAQINELAAHSLTWESRSIESLIQQGATRSSWNNAGHSLYKASGYPVGYAGQNFSTRRQYLTYRLTERIRRVGQVNNAEGKAAADELRKARAAEEKAKKEAIAKARLEQPQTSFSIAVKAAVAERIPNYRKPHKINLFDWEGDRVCLQRASDSEGDEICREKVWVKKASLVAGVKVLKDSRDILANIPKLDIGDVAGVTLNAPVVPSIQVAGDNPEERYYNSSSNLNFFWDQENEGHIFMEVQDWKFRFHFDDFATTVASLGQEWVAVPKSQAPTTPVAAKDFVTDEDEDED